MPIFLTDPQVKLRKRLDLAKETDLAVDGATKRFAAASRTDRDVCNRPQGRIVTKRALNCFGPNVYRRGQRTATDEPKSPQNVTPLPALAWGTSGIALDFHV